jgi:hypothetical protein
LAESEFYGSGNRRRGYSGIDVYAWGWPVIYFHVYVDVQEDAPNSFPEYIRHVIEDALSKMERVKKARVELVGPIPSFEGGGL